MIKTSIHSIEPLVDLIKTSIHSIEPAGLNRDLRLQMPDLRHEVPHRPFKARDSGLDFHRLRADALHRTPEKMKPIKDAATPNLLPSARNVARPSRCIAIARG